MFEKSAASNLFIDETLKTNLWQHQTVFWDGFGGGLMVVSQHFAKVQIDPTVCDSATMSCTPAGL